VSNDFKGQPPAPVRKTASALATRSVAPATEARDARRYELQLLINSHTPIISVETSEEDRLERLLLQVAARMGVPLYTWGITAGLKKFTGAPIYGTDDQEKALANIALINGDAVFLLKDFARYCDNDRISRRLRDLADAFRSARRSIVISAPALKLPAELEADAAVFQLGLPTAEELLPSVNQALADASREQGIPVALDAVGVSQLAHNLVGLTEEEATRTLRKCLLARGKADAGLLESVLDTKHEAMRAGGLLEPVRRDASFSDVAGLKHLREWIDKRRSAFTPEGRQFGLVPPKGVLITGVQGCGKSLAARAVAGEWGVELARLDAGALYDKYVGESERRLNKTLELAQKLAPVVLWIDEIEKAFASAGTSGDSDAGLSQRLLATLLTWMQDRESGVFLAATSNNITALPPEMLRKGRFDEIFFVDLPGADVRAALFSLYLKKRGRDTAGFDLSQLAAATNGFSGAEIEQAVAAGLYTAFDRKQQLSTEILLGEIRGTQPLSVTRAEDIEGIREWAKSRAVAAD
jgi:ATP-dependent 26S proteasome regulatory subunit